MNKIPLTVCAAFASVLLQLPAAGAAAPNSYQVTGPVLELTDSTITVQKGNERWEIARDPATKSTGELKVGSKVTVHYTMVAKSVEVKADKTAPAAEKPAADTGEKKP